VNKARRTRRRNVPTLLSERLQGPENDSLEKKMPKSFPIRGGPIFRTLSCNRRKKLSSLKWRVCINRDEIAELAADTGRRNRLAHDHLGSGRVAHYPDFRRDWIEEYSIVRSGLNLP
jgi:hypothetical protein